MRRKVSPTDSSGFPNGPDADKLIDAQQVSSAICNGEDLGPLVRRAFAAGKPEHLLQSLRHFTRAKEQEIEEVCKAHYQDFIRAVDDLRSLLSDVESLKSSIHESNAILQSVAVPLLTSLDAYVEARSQARNIALALASARLCVRLFDLCRRANEHISGDDLYLALRCLDAVETGGYLDSAPSPSIRRMLEATIPAIRAHAERRIAREFGDWLVQIRVVSRNLGQVAIARASAARQREEELRTKQRQAEEQSRFSGTPRYSSSGSDFESIYTLHEDDDDDITAAPLPGVPCTPDPRPPGQISKVLLQEGILGFDLTPLYRAYHVHQTLGLQDRFRKYYFENRKLQLSSDFQVSSMTPFLESHQTFFAQIAGFFVVEDRILRTGGGLISRYEVDSLWDTAVSKVVSVLEDQFSRMQTANHLLLIKDYVSLFGVTLRRYGYTVDSLLDVLSKHRDKYHELLLSDCRKQISEALAADKFDPLLMRKEYEYSMNVLSFQLQTSDIMPAFPYVAPFSSMVPDCCRIVRSFIEDSISFMSYGGMLDFYDVVKKYLDKLLTGVLDEAMLKIVEQSVHVYSQAMQVAANMTAFERACDFFFRHAAQQSGIPLRMAERGRREFPLRKSRQAAETLLLDLLRAKVDDFMSQSDSVNWMADIPPPSGNEYAIEVLLFLETLVSNATVQQLPLVVLKQVLQGVLAHISGNIIGLFLADSVKRFNENAVSGIDTDLKSFESFAEGLPELLPDMDESAGAELKLALTEARQMVNLLLSSNPENYMNPVIRQKNYDRLDHRQVVIISEKFNNSSERLFSTFGTRGAKQNPKKKALDSLIKRLKDAA